MSGAARGIRTPDPVITNEDQACGHRIARRRIELQIIALSYWFISFFLMREIVIGRDLLRSNACTRTLKGTQRYASHHAPPRPDRSLLCPCQGRRWRGADRLFR